MTVPAGYLDDGRFSNFWWRDQVASTNRLLCDDFSATTYPASGTQYFRVTPLWVRVGGRRNQPRISRFARRFLIPGSRQILEDWEPVVLPESLRDSLSVERNAGLGGDYCDHGDERYRLLTCTDEAGGAAAFGDLTVSGDGHYIRLQDDQSRTTKWRPVGHHLQGTTYTVNIRCEKESAGTPQAGATFVVSLVTSGTHLLFDFDADEHSRQFVHGLPSHRGVQQHRRGLGTDG